jgi:hypothetical protein
MEMFRSVLAAAAFGLALSIPVRADEPPQGAVNDVRCLVVGLRFANSSNNATVAYAGKIVASYYFGRIKAEAPNLNVQDQVDHEAAAMSGDAIAAESTRCGADFQTQSAAMLDLANRASVRR